VISIFILTPPPAPTADDLAPAPITVWQGLEPASPTPPTTVVTTPITQPDACQTVFDMARHVGWAEQDLTQLIAIAYRESRCNPAAFNASDPNGGSAGVMQINYFWCKPSTYWPTGWLQAQSILDNCAQLFDPQINARAAVAIWRNSGWLPWKISK
jgi:hypothetical protein